MAKPYTRRERLRLLPKRWLAALLGKPDATGARPAQLLEAAVHDNKPSYLAELKHRQLEARAEGREIFTADELTKAVYVAILCDHHACLKTLLTMLDPRQEGKPNDVDGGGLLHTAVFFERYVEDLLRWGVDTERCNKKGLTPFAAAILECVVDFRKYKPICRLFAKYGANPNPNRKRGQALIGEALGKLGGGKAVLGGGKAVAECRKELIGLMLELNADVNRPDAFGCVMAHHFEDVDYHRKLPHFPSIAEQVLERMTSLECPDEDGNRLLLTAAKKQAFGAIDALIKRGANLHAVNKEGQNIAHHLACTGFLLSFLAEKGVAMDLADSDGDTPLLVASDAGPFAGVAYLASLESVNIHRQERHTGETALHRLLDRITEHRNENAWLHQVLDTGAIDALVQRGADLLLKDREGRSALELAEGMREASLMDGVSQRDPSFVSAQLRHELADQVAGFPATCRGAYFMDEGFSKKPLAQSDFIQDGAPTPMLRHLAGAGILAEAFHPGHWQGRPGEARETIKAALDALPDFQRHRYRQTIDLVPFLPPALVSMEGFVRKTASKPKLGGQER